MLMRQLEFEQKDYWDKKSQISPKMLEEKDCDPTLLSGWTDRDISLWDVSETNGRPGLLEILFALCRSKKDWKKISYLQFPREAIDTTGLSLTSSPGKTNDNKINQSNVHFEIKGITGKELCTLLFNVYNGTFKTGVFTKKEYDTILLDIYDSTEIRQTVYGATSKSTNIISASSGSGMEQPSPVSTPNKTYIEPIPISSTSKNWDADK